MKEISLTNSHELPLSHLLLLADRRMLSVAGQRIYDPFKIFLGTGHVLKEELSRLLVTTQLLFYCEQEKVRKMTLNDISVPSKIHFNFLTEDQSNFIIQKIDVHNTIKYDFSNPFNFDYGVFGYYLNPKKNYSQLLSCWSDILINEWRVIHGYRLFMGFGYDIFSENLHNGNRPLELLGFSDDEMSMVGETGVNLILLRGLWLANNIIIRLQAIWDKMITEFLLKNYFSIKSFGKRLPSKIDKLKNIIDKGDLPKKQQEYLGKFCEMTESIKELREWRDHDVHMVSEYITDVYSRKSSDKDLHQLWKRIDELHNTTKEALFSLIGIIVSEGNYEPKYILRVLGEGKQDGKKSYNPNNPEDKTKLEELRAHFVNNQERKNPQRIIDILSDLWGIEITSDICQFITFAAKNP